MRKIKLKTVLEVKFNSVPATEYTSLSDSSITCRVPGGIGTGPGAIVASAANGASNGNRVFQPNESRPAYSSKTINPRRDYGLVSDFSTKIECLEKRSIAVDRTMYWAGEEAGAGVSGGGGAGEGHSSIGVTSPANTWYLAEGSSAWGFECWLLIQNPNDVDVKVRVSYLTEGAKGNSTFDAVVSANSRMSFNMGDKLVGGRAAVLVECLTGGRKVMTERSTYWNARGSGACTIGGFSD